MDGTGLEAAWVVLVGFDLSRGMWVSSDVIETPRADWGRTCSTNVELHDAQCGSGIYTNTQLILESP